MMLMLFWVRFVSGCLMLLWCFFDRFDKKKGFFCQIVGNDKTKCLGRGKGRRYPPMDTRSEALLKSFYHKPNVALSKLLGRLGQPVPDWLTEELSNWR